MHHQHGEDQRAYESQVVVEIDEYGKYVACCSALQACYSQGDMYEEAMENIRDVIAMCMEELEDANQPR